MGTSRVGVAAHPGVADAHKKEIGNKAAKRQNTVSTADSNTRWEQRHVIQKSTKEKS